MNMALRKAALPISLLAAGVCTVMYAGANAARTAGKAAAARDTPLCAFVKKVAAAAPTGFAAFKGGADSLHDNRTHTAHEGTRAPDGNAQCRLYVARDDDTEVQRYYSCQLGPARTLAEAKPVFEKKAAELRAGFPAWKFEETRVGDESKREETWTVRSERKGFTVYLNLFDAGYLEELKTGKPSAQPGVRIHLEVTATAPEKEKSKTAAAKEGTAKPALCEFIEKVLAAQADDFAAIRAEQADKLFGNYEGKFTPDAQSTCNVWPHEESKGPKSRALYSCQMRRAKTMAEMKPEYERIKAELQACDAGLRFKERSEGAEKTHDEMWYFSGANGRVRVSLQALDNRFMIDTAPELVNEMTKQTPASLTLSIRALPPAGNP